MKFNINERVRIKLTQAGMEHLLAHRSAQNEQIKAIAPKYKPPTKQEWDGDEWLDWPLWEVMQTFGPGMTFGGENLFETDIELEERPMKLSDCKPGDVVCIKGQPNSPAMTVEALVGSDAHVIWFIKNDLSAAASVEGCWDLKRDRINVAALEHWVKDDGKKADQRPEPML